MTTPIRRLALDRRTFLQGAGACVALPTLDAMTPALARGAGEAPTRAVFLFAPNGKKMDDWTPKAEGKGYKAPFLLEPLQRHRQQVTVLSGLTLDGGRAHGDGPGDHARAAASYLTCAHPRKTGGNDIHVGVSVDQAIAQKIGGATQFASLELGTEPGRSAGVCDSGYSCAYSNNISWRAPNVPVPKETSPREVFTRLFGDPDGVQDQARAAAERERRRSVLDTVLADAKSLTKKLGAADREKLDQYFTAVREVEQRLAADETGGGEPGIEPPAGVQHGRGKFENRLPLMYELIALALQTDRSRVVTFMLGNAGSNRSYRWLDVPQGHHNLSHHGKKPDKLAQIRKINRWHVEQFANFLDRLKSVKDGSGTLLDHAAIVYGSGLADGNRHRHENLPIVLAGGAGGQTKGGRHLRFPKETPMADLYLRIMEWMGAPAPNFADSKAALTV